LLDEFSRLICDSCVFVDSWSAPEITPSTYRLYGKKHPAKEASKRFVEQIRQRSDIGILREHYSDDVENPLFSHCDWTKASESTKASLDNKVKEPRTLLLYRGAVYEFTYNDRGKFSQSQIGLLYDVPLQIDLDRCKKFNTLVAPPGVKDITWDRDATKQHYLDLGFVEQKVGLAPERTQFLSGDLQAQRRQYGLKHRVTSTIHAAMGDTLTKVAIEISKDDPSFQLWDKAQVVVALSRTKYARNLIFVGSKRSTIWALQDLLQVRSKWSDYIDDVLKLVTVDEGGENDHRVMTQREFPFRICDVELPACRTGYVYFLISVRSMDYTYIGQTMCIRTRLRSHNSGYGSSSTEPVHLRPFALMAFICGFDGRKRLREFVEYMWKQRRDQLIRRGIHDPRMWVRCGEDVIREVNVNDLRLVCFFK
jgi:hypothetical protein